MATKPYALPLGVHDALQILAHSQRGRTALANLLILFIDGGISLDAQGQRALITLIAAAYDRPGTVLDALRQVVGT